MPKIVRELLLIPHCFSHHLRVIGALRKCADMRELLLPVSDLGSLLKLGALATAFPEAGRFPTAFFRLFFFAGRIQSLEISKACCLFGSVFIAGT